MPCIFQELHEVPSLRAIRTPSHHPHSHRDKPCSQRQAQAWPARPSRCPIAGWPAPKSPPSPSPWPPLSLEESLLELGQIKKLLNLVHSSPSESQGQESLQLPIARIRSLNQLGRSGPSCAPKVVRLAASWPPEPVLCSLPSSGGGCPQDPAERL